MDNLSIPINLFNLFIMKNFLVSVLQLISGKKATIATILGAILIFTLNRGYIAADTGQLISIILIALGLGSNIAGKYLLDK